MILNTNSLEESYLDIYRGHNSVLVFYQSKNYSVSYHNTILSYRELN
jgi:hypothetical protein